MTISPTITLDARLSVAFTKRITGGATAETLAATIVQEWAAKYATADDAEKLTIIGVAAQKDPTLIAKLEAAIAPKPSK